MKVGVGPVRTGVTAVLPRGKSSNDAVFAGWFTLNGNGEMTGTTWVEESGFLDGPGHDHQHAQRGRGARRGDRLAGEACAAGCRKAIGGHCRWSPKPGTDDLNDINGFHVKPEHVLHALDTAHGGPVEEGSVGGGTGMICNEFKGGIGTSSRVLDAKVGGYTVGVLVQCNYGRRRPVAHRGSSGRPGDSRTTRVRDEDIGSIIVVVATDAPLIPTQLKRVARRVSLGLGRDGSYCGDGSGDIFIAFSTANPGVSGSEGSAPADHASQRQRLNPIFLATVQATEEAVVNAMVAAKTMKGINDYEVIGLPHDRLREVLKKYNRLAK